MRGMVNQKVVPCPTLDMAPIWPPSTATCLLQMLSPSPVPPLVLGLAISSSVPCPPPSLPALSKHHYHRPPAPARPPTFLTVIAISAATTIIKVIISPTTTTIIITYLTVQLPPPSPISIISIINHQHHHHHHQPDHYHHPPSAAVQPATSTSRSLPSAASILASPRPENQTPSLKTCRNMDRMGRIKQEERQKRGKRGESHLDTTGSGESLSHRPQGMGPKRQGGRASGEGRPNEEARKGGA